MADESSAAVTALNREIDRLNAQVTNLKGENTRRKATAQGIARALGVTNPAELRDVIETLNQAGPLRKVLADFQTLKSARPGDWQVRAEKAEGELRTVKHRDGFAALYKDAELGIRPEVPVDRLMTVLGYKAEGDAFDAEGVKGRIKALKTTDPYLFGPGGDAAPGDQSPPAPAPPAWGGRGASGRTAGGVSFTDAQLRDPAFMLAHAGDLVEK